MLECGEYDVCYAKMISNVIYYDYFKSQSQQVKPMMLNLAIMYISNL